MDLHLTHLPQVHRKYDLRSETFELPQMANEMNAIVKKGKHIQWMVRTRLRSSKTFQVQYHSTLMDHQMKRVVCNTNLAQYLSART